jgi:hypothetical protein
MERNCPARGTKKEGQKKRGGDGRRCRKWSMRRRDGWVGRAFLYRWQTYQVEWVRKGDPRGEEKEEG